MKEGSMQTILFVQSQVPTAASILDVGCGNGSIAKGLRDLGYIVTAIDGNSNAVAEA
ncbi:MAG: class I SAM-dependent methyltransferase, partial [Candidatus Obscuribacterales bacterium]|nr:class I SAM-dependent methyltransferase [Candidatus Obscuribacterales bacterium]